MTDQAAWAVAETLHRQEQLAAHAVTALGYLTWLPMYRKLLRGVRLDGAGRVRSRRDTFEMRPLFRGYLFVLLPHDAACQDIDKAHGVRRLMRHPAPDEHTTGAPKLVRARVIVQLKEIVDMGIYEDDGGTLRYGSVQPRIKQHAKVRTPAGIVATVLSLDDQGRADLLAELMGAKRVIRRVDARTLQLLDTVDSH